MKNIFIITYFVIFFIIAPNCISYKPRYLPLDKEKKIENVDHGYILFKFNEDKREKTINKTINDIYWFFELKVNNELYFSGYFSKDYLIPVPKGLLTLEYSLSNSDHYGHMNLTGYSFFPVTTQRKKINIYINKNKTYILSIKNVGNPKKFCTCILIGIPWLGSLQEVEFQIDNNELLESENANNR
jgi:hypothetical protein